MYVQQFHSKRDISMYFVTNIFSAVWLSYPISFSNGSSFNDDLTRYRSLRCGASAIVVIFDLTMTIIGLWPCRSQLLESCDTSWRDYAFPRRRFAWFIAVPAGGKAKKIRFASFVETFFYWIKISGCCHVLGIEKKKKKKWGKPERKMIKVGERWKYRVKIVGATQCYAAETFAKDFRLRCSREASIFVETFMPGFSNTVICEGWNQQTVLSYELNYFFLLLCTSVSSKNSN